MKKQFTNILLTISVIVLLAMIFGCNNGTWEEGDRDGNYDTRPIVCFGDSLTAGYGADGYGTSNAKTYPYYLQSKVKCPVINAGVTGDTTAGGLARIDNDVLANNPQAVIIEFGANDLWHGLTVPQIKNNLGQMIGRIHNGERKIYIANWVPHIEISQELLTIMNMFRVANGIKPLTLAELTTTINDFNVALNSLANTENVTLVDNIFQGIFGNASYMHDPIHPNTKGYERMADRYFTVLKPYLQANNLLK